MNASRSARLLAGLTTGGLLAAGLTYLGTAPASAEASDPLGFDIAALAATGDGRVIAVGSAYDVDGEGGTETPHAALVEGADVTPVTGLPDDGGVKAVTVLGSTALLFGSDADGAAAAWSVDLAAGDAESGPTAVAGAAPPLSRVTASAPAALVVAGTTWNDEEGVADAVVAFADTTVALGPDVTPAAVTTNAAGKIYVVGTEADGETGRLWLIDEDSSVAPVAVGSYPSAVVASDSTVFVADSVEGAGEIRALDATTGEALGAADFGDAPVDGMTLSSDGETLFAAAGYQLYAIPVDDVADFDVESAETIEADGWLGPLASWEHDGSTTLFSSLDGAAIGTFGAPEKPVVTAKVDPASPTTLEFTVAGDAQGLHATVTSDADKVVFDGVLDTYGDGRECSYGFDENPSTCWIEGLDYATTYTVVVSSSNFLGSTASDPQTVATLGLLNGPSTATFTGTAQVGKTLTAVTSTGWPAGTDVQYGWGIDGGQWGDFVAGRTLALTPGLAGTKVTLIVTGAKDGFAIRTVRSTAVTVAAAPVVALPPLVINNPKKARQATPKVAGTPKVGHKVSAAVKVTAWPKGTKVRFQWYVNGKPIKGATKKTLKVTKKLKGKKVQVVAIGTKPGYAPAVKKSKPVRIR